MANWKARLRGGGVYSIENVPLMVVLVGTAELLLAAAVYVSLQYAGSPSVLTRAFSIAAAAVGSAVVALSMVIIWNNSVVKPAEVERCVRQVPWGGDEVVAEVSCGNGLALLRSATRLSYGLAVGFEASAGGRLAKSVPEARGVQAGLCSADSRSLPLRDGSLDVVFSGFGMRRFRRLADRMAEVDEMARVLKLGGRVVLMVAGDPAAAEVMLRRKGLVEVETTLLKSFLLFTTRIVSARKPAYRP